MADENLAETLIFNKERDEKQRQKRVKGDDGEMKNLLKHIREKEENESTRRGQRERLLEEDE